MTGLGGWKEGRETAPERDFFLRREGRNSRLRALRKARPQRPINSKPPKSDTASRLAQSRWLQ
jgi:hypothetical protein